MRCATHIVECLRNKGIEPEAFASSYEGENHKPSNALKYNDSSTFFTPENSKYKDMNQWWAVNFRNPITINSYQIKAPESTTSNSAIYEWNFSVSFDNETWKIVDSPEKGSPGDKIFKIRPPVNALFVRINGRSQRNDYKTKFHFYHIKFFGSITPLRELKRCTCRSARAFSQAFTQMILLVSFKTST